MDDLELVGPVPGPLAGGEGPHAGSGSLPDLTAGRAAVAAVRNSALLIDDQQLRQRIGTALSYMELCTLPGMFDTLRADIVWPDTCRDIRECVAAYARGDNLPHPPSTYELYDRALAPLEEASKQAMAALRKYAEKVKSERT